MKKKTTRFITEFLKMEAAGGILLMLTAALAVISANISDLSSLYEAFLHLYPFSWIPGIKAVGLNLSLHHIINDGLMAVFFFLVGLELKREMLEGELSNRQNIMLPVIGAVGGMLIPALIYTALNIGDATAMRGWAVPTATDIAFALGVLTLLGSGVPNSLKIFLTSLAIFDDLGAVLIIAFFYTSKIFAVPLAVVAGCVVVLAMLNRMQVLAKAPYLLVGAIMWFATLKSGVHATLAGVLLAMFIPLSSAKNPEISPLKSLEHSLHTVVAYCILPVFAFANSGLNLKGVGMDQVLHSVLLGIALGLVVGKQIGVFGLCFLSLKLKIAQLPKGINMGHLYGASLLCGIGFTMSLFIGGLAFQGGGAEKLFDERIGIILGSLISGGAGYAVLRMVAGRAAAAK
ncbi:sodium/proton antiporter, NhaA family [Candidatus Electrothrix communis]|uniref:Na(+)/H(+) antiporter NhaA n=1 Tax=Candidatus Electrothrix communis TaxID=1859133 RepID=A0A3S3QKF2_9BACT|nr:sodium/proton antiporter, NhaA family [Candidatus Electrothrix communis]